MANPFPRDKNRVPVIGGIDSSTGLATAATIDDATGGLDVNIVGGGSGGGTVNQGTPNTVANAWPIEVSDQTNAANVLKSDGTAAGQNALLGAGTHLTVSFSTTTAQAVGTTDCANYRSVSVHITSQGTNSDVFFQGSNDNTHWVSIALAQPSNTLSSPSTDTTSSGVIFSGPLSFRYFRLNVSGISAGTTAGVIEFFTYADPTLVTIAGQIALNGTQASNLLQIGGNNVASVGTGVLAVNTNSATGAAVPANGFYAAGQAINAEITARSNGNLGGLVTDLVGKLIMMPYANKENFLSGVATSTGSSAASVISAQGAGVKIYITRVVLANTGSTTSLVTLQNDPAGTPSTLAYLINPAGGGGQFTFDPPLVSAANKAVGWTPGSASTTQYITIDGYAGV